MASDERRLEEDLIAKLGELKYVYRDDIRDRRSLEANFREKFQQLNRVKLTDEEFQRLLEEIVTPDVFTAAQVLRSRNSFADCIRPSEDDPDKTMYARVVNIMSHGNYSVYEPLDMMEENKALFRKVLSDFRKHFQFNPALFNDLNNEASAP